MTLYLKHAEREMIAATLPYMPEARTAALLKAEIIYYEDILMEFMQFRDTPIKALSVETEIIKKLEEHRKEHNLPHTASVTDCIQEIELEIRHLETELARLLTTYDIYPEDYKSGNILKVKESLIDSPNRKAMEVQEERVKLPKPKLIPKRLPEIVEACADCECVECVCEDMDRRGEEPDSDCEDSE